MALLCVLTTATLYADKRWTQTDGIEEAIELQSMVRDAQFDLMQMWIQCELDHLCVCEKKPELYNTTNNFVLKVFIERDREQDSKRCKVLNEYYDQLCRIPANIDVQQAVIPCYDLLQKGQYLSDESLFNAGQVCIAEKLQPFLNQANLFAINAFIDFLTTYPNRFPGQLGFYETLLESKKGTEAYNEFSLCQSILDE